MSKFSSGGASRREALRATLRVLVASLTSPAGWVGGLGGKVTVYIEPAARGPKN